MSSNPFRKKALGTIDTARASSPRSSMRSEDVQAGNRKSKPTKRVRVLSPPPLSPDSPEWPFKPVPPSDDAYSNSNYLPSFDPFNGALTDESDGEGITTPPPGKYQHPLQQQDGRSGGIPTNPFNKTLQDTTSPRDPQRESKEEGEALKAANEGRKSLNVDSFKRLLMTGDAGHDTFPAPTDAEEEAIKNMPSTTQTDATARNHAYPESSVDSSDENEDQEESKTRIVPSQPLSRDKKAPPPPPSSRHGKSLKQPELQDVMEDDGITTTLPAGISMDHDEPPPPSPEAPNVAGGEADAGPQTDSNPIVSGTKRPAPAPPPPRGHARTDSKSHDNEAPPQRTSPDGMPNRSDNTRSTGPAPAPPPPRRPHATPRQTGTSSTSTTSASAILASSSTDQVQDASRCSHDGPTPSKASPAPPPPPARQPSGRRPPSVTGVDAPSRRVSSENKSRDGVPPPPPPPRHCGNSPNTDARNASSESYVADPSKSADILADLDALQREVDALRGQMK
ncbi:uncharacterized protein MAM_01080 [Metarhizium album ARSEF 1941]|uniref:Uncharacterized protein n=1 Tax=Metarhizium album (strain ARSEF 1941) TaxID=1081103 RepID=A0A0B2X6R0_METAS|nr:uncharacterized protein MAM_01080 [Metarhizium album ARSEF 1941]KHO02079.1 hypothetical protein MAM_01080 [Metarhizium album ARSEF 1941]